MVCGILIRDILSLADRVIGRLTGRRPEAPSFEGIIEDLFAAWPQDAWELMQAQCVPLPKASGADGGPWERLGTRPDRQTAAFRLSSM